MADPLRVVAWLDGRPGHESQVRGLLSCLPVEAHIHDARLPDDIPEASERKLGFWALATKHMGAKPPRGLLEELIPSVWRDATGFAPQLSIAAGTRGGLYSYALGRLEWCPMVQAMTHGLLKTAFTLNVVPAHDGIPAGPKVIVTTTAPNPYLPAEANRLAIEFLAPQGLPDGVYWSVLIGGLTGDQTAKDIDAEAVVAELRSFLRTAAEHGARVLISTSRRTPDHLADALREVIAPNALVAYYQDFRHDQSRTAGALLGAATQAFLTPDSVSMVSEALWAGRGVTLLPLQRDPRSQPLVASAKHKRFLAGLLEAGQVRWYGPSWEPPRTRTDLEYRHQDFLAIQSRLRELLKDVAR